MSDSPTTIEQLARTVKEQNRRISHLEKQIKTIRVDRDYSEQEAEEPKIEKAKPKKELNISPTMVITAVGIIGVVIGLVSFFMHAISNNWIGPTAQISIGVIAGLALFVAGYVLYDKHQKWAITAFGGAIIVELISVGFGVWYYDIINGIFALILLLIFLSVGMSLSIKYDSLLIAYFSIGGGMITPIVSKIYTKPMFTAIFLLLLAVGVLVLSNYKKWTSLRMVSFLSITGYEFYLFNSFHPTYTSGLSAETSIIFLTIFFLIYNIISIIFSIRQDQKISELDITLLNLNTFFSAILLIRIFFFGDEVITKTIFGIILLVASFFFLIEMYYLKNKYEKNKHLKPTLYSLLSSGIILINVGLVLIFFRQSLINLIILALPQWLLYSYLSRITKDEKYYNVFSYIFLAVALFWWAYYVIKLPPGIDKATYVILMMVVFLAALFFSIKKDLFRAVNGFLLIFLGYAFFYPLTEYIQLITALSDEVTTTILSGIWLAYALTLYIKTREKEKFKVLSILSLVLLIITLVKIAFLDLTRLEGVVKIIGFIVFGVLLLIGGYMLKK